MKANSKFKNLFHLSPTRMGRSTTTSLVVVFGLTSMDAVAQTVVLVGPNNPGSIAPIDQVTLNDNGTTVVQNSSQPPSTNIQRDTPVFVENIRLTNGENLQIFNFEGAEAELLNFAVQTPSPSGIGVVQSDGSTITLAGNGEAAYETAIEQSLADPNINTYLFYDGVSPVPTPGTPDFRLNFRFAYQPDDYIFVQERNGNTFFEITPLDINGDPIVGANVLRFGENGGANFSVYDWNTGYANSVFQNQQEYAFSVASASLFFDGSGIAPQPVFGFQIDNDGQADVKFFGASEDTFLNNPFNPDIPGADPVPGRIAGFVRFDNEPDGTFEDGIVGVTIELVDSSGVVVDTLVTGTGGFYRFENVVPGDYTVRQTQPAGFITVTDGDNTNGGDDAPNTSTTDNEIPVSVVSNETDNRNDFIETPIRAAITGSVLVDSDNDGLGDTALEGVVIELLDDSGAVVGTTITAADGGYNFDGLLPGDYTVREVQPTGFQNVTDGDTTNPGDDAVNTSTTDNEIPVTLVAGETDTGNDFVEQQLGEIRGLVRVDIDNNDSGDEPIPGVTIELLDDAGNVIATTTTNANGAYVFGGLVPGDYTVREIQPAGFLNVSDRDFSNAGDDAPNVSSTDDEIPVSVVGGELDGGNNFVEERSSSISGTVSVDTDNDGLGDDPIANVTIELIDDAGNVVATTTTDASGDYDFQNVAPGDYTVSEVQPASFATVTDGDSTAPGDDATNASTTDNQIPVSVFNGESDTGNDFVEQQLGEIRGIVRVDIDNNDSGDEPIPGVTIELLDDAGNVIATTTTNANGAYVFGGLVPGDYTVREIQPAGFLNVSDRDFSNAGDDAPNVSSTDDEIPVSVIGGEVDGGNNFVEERFSSISGTVSADTDNDGLGDDPIANVTIELIDDAGNVVATTTTDASGDYDFQNVAPGDYTVSEVQPAGFATVTDGDSTAPGDDATNASTTDNQIPVSVFNGESDTGNDFVEEQPSSISGTVLNDTDNDGVGEDPIAGVTIELVDAAGNVVATTTTDGSGDYLFEDVTPGDFIVREVQPAGFTTVTDGDTTNPGDDATNASTTDNEIPVTVTAGEADTGNNFVEEQPNSISGTVLNDTDNDGVGEDPIAGVTIELVDAAGNVVATTTTNGSGDYFFEDVTPGDFIVREVQPAGFTTVTDGDTTNPGDDATNASTTDNEIPVTVTAGEADTGNNFVEEQPNSISGTVLNDTDNDGVGEDPIAGVTIELVDAAGNVVATTTTDGSGSYLFEDVTPGDFIVREVQPAGFTTVTDGDTTNPGDDATNASTTDNEIPVTVTAGEADTGNNFVEEQPNSISGTVLNDTDNNGVGEDPIAGVTIELVDAAGNVVATTTTDGSGSYLFEDVTPGDFIVREVQPAGFATVTDGDTTNPGDDATNASTTDNEIPVTVTAGEADTGNNFVEEEFGSIRGVVRVDIDNDDIGEDPIPGVTIELVDAAGNVVATTTTIANGSYSFGNVVPGDYTVREIQPAGFITVVDRDASDPGDDATNANPTDDEIPVSVTAGESDGGNNFVEERPGSVSGTVLADTDNDDLGDDPIAGVTLELVDAAGNVVATTTTDGSGNFLFEDVTPGDFIVREVQPDGFADVTDGDTTNPGDDATNASTTDNEIPVSVFDGEADTGNNFVEEQPGSVSGTVLADTDNDDLGDDPIAGVTLELVDAAGNVVATTTTDGSGNFLFEDVTPGDFIVREVQPAGFADVTDGDTTNPGDDATNASTTDNEIPVTVTAGEADTGNNFVEEQPGSVSGTVLADTDNDDLGDDPIAGVTLELVDAAGNVVATTTTDGSGNFLFEDVTPGDFIVREVQPAGFVDVTDGDTTNPGDDATNASTTDNEIPVTVTAGEADTGNNFVEEQPGSVSGTVLADTDNDDLGDDPIAGVTLELVDAAGNVVATTTTDGSGNFLFEDVTPGDFIVREVQPAGFADVTDGDTTNPGDDATNASTTDNEIPVTVTAGEDDNGNNFVEEPLGSITGTVLEDTNGDGIGDAPIAGVVLQLKDAAGNLIDGDPSTAGVQPITATTDSSGVYNFPNLPAGSYQVCEVQPAGFLSVGDTDGANNDIVGDQTPIVVEPGLANGGNDFVELAEKPDSFADFLAEYASELGGETAPSDNPDGDIYSNALEYALWLNPGSGVPNAGEFCIEKDAETLEVRAEFSRRLGGLSDVNYVLEIADTLGTPTVWTDVTSVSPTIVTNDPELPIDSERVVYENLQTASELSAANFGVARLRVELDANGDGAITADEIHHTDVFGWQCVGHQDRVCATYSNPFSLKPSFSGTFGDGALTLSTDANGNVTLDVSDSANGADLSAIAGKDGEYYLQITSGALEGHRFDILGGGVDTITLVNDDDIFEETVPTFNTLNGLPADSLLNGASYEVIRFRTVDEQFDRLTQFAGEEDTRLDDLTRVLLYNNRRTNPGFDVLGLTGTSTADSRWVFVDEFLIATDRGGLRLDPCGGAWVHPRNSDDIQNPTTPAPVVMISVGLVADHDQVCPLDDGFNLLGAMWPLDQTPAGVDGRDFTVASGLVGAIDPSESAELLFWQADNSVDVAGSVGVSNSYQNYQLIDTGAINQWTLNPDLFLRNQDEILIFESHRSHFLRLADGNEIISHVYPQPNF